MESFLDKIKRAQASGDKVFVYRDGVAVDPENIPDGEALVDFYEKFENKRLIVLRGDTLTVATYMALFGRKFCQRVIVVHDGFYLNTCFPSVREEVMPLEVTAFEKTELGGHYLYVRG